MTDVLDRRVLEGLSDSVGGDREFYVELIDEFLVDAPRQLQTLRDGAIAGDAETTRRAAHTLKGNGRTFGATELASLFQEVEAAAANGDLDPALSRSAEISDAWERVRAALVAERDGI